MTTQDSPGWPRSARSIVGVAEPLRVTAPDALRVAPAEQNSSTSADTKVALAAGAMLGDVGRSDGVVEGVAISVTAGVTGVAA